MLGQSLIGISTKADQIRKDKVFDRDGLMSSRMWQEALGRKGVAEAGRMVPPKSRKDLP